MTWRSFLGCLCLLLVSGWLGADEASPHAIARVAGEVITQERYHTAFSEQLRQRFYHGSVPQERVLELEQAVLQQLVDAVLLRQEAVRLGVAINKENIEKDVAQWSAQFGGEVAPDAMVKYERDKRIDKAYAEALRAYIEAYVGVGSEDELVAYYESNKAKFTRPEQLKLSLILLTVAPYEHSPVWQAAYDKAQGLVDRIKQGEAFAKLAQEHSGHESASKGGDLGFVHTGMLSSELQEIVNGLAVGEMAERPVVLLQGVAVLRLEGRIAPELVAYSQAKPRVGALWKDERRKQKWDELLVRLRKENPVAMQSAN